MNYELDDNLAYIPPVKPEGETQGLHSSAVALMCRSFGADSQARMWATIIALLVEIEHGIF